MNFNELTRVMLSSMDFFELRRTAARYGVPYQGVRRIKLLRDLERKITGKYNPGEEAIEADVTAAEAGSQSTARSKRSGSKAENDSKKASGMKINTYSSGNAITRTYGG